MTINITTKANNGHLIVHVKNSAGVIILTVAGTGSGSCMLVPGSSYRFDWYVWSAQAADYSIDASATPPTSGFPQLSFTKKYSSAMEDAGGFPFTA